MGKQRKTREFAKMKRMMSTKDSRLQKDIKKPEKKANTDEPELKEVQKVSSALFFASNKNIRPPYQVLVDTNFINFSIQNKLDIFKSMMDCLLAKCNPCITDCVIAELEKLGRKYRLALRLAKDPRMTRLTCCHKGTYADDCIVDRVTQHRCYLVGTNDKDLKNRIRKIPGVPIVYVMRGKYGVEKLPESITSIPIRTTNKF
jgi:U3 small nucleolar RNA-associated protein 24